MTKLARVLTWTVVLACAAPRSVTPSKTLPPLQQKDMLDLAFEPRSDAWLLRNSSGLPVFAPSCGALTTHFEWRTRSGWEEAPTFIPMQCGGGCSSRVDAVSSGTSTDVSCDDALVASTYRARVRLVDADGKVFDLIRALEVTGLSERDSDAFVDSLTQPEALACLPYDTFQQLVQGFALVGTRAAVRRLRDVRTGELLADAAILRNLSFVPDGIDDLAAMADQPSEQALAAQLAFSATRPCRRYPDVPPCKKILDGWLERPVREELLDALVGALPMDHRDDAVFCDYLVANIPGAPADALPKLLFVLFGQTNPSQEQVARAVPLMKWRMSTVSGAARRALAEAMADVAARSQGYGVIGHSLETTSRRPPAACADLERRMAKQLYSEVRATLESKGHLPMKTVGHSMATWNGRRVESPERVLACEHPIRICE